MPFEKFGKMIGSIAASTAKVAGEQVQITKLGIDRAGVERQIEGVYAAMGRYCYSRIKAGDDLPPELSEYSRDIDALMEQLAEIDNEIELHKNERTAAEGSFKDLNLQAAQAGSGSIVIDIDPAAPSSGCVAEAVAEIADDENSGEAAGE